MVEKRKNCDYQKSNKKIGYDLANFISVFIAPPTMVIVATIIFSFLSPIGLGSLSIPLSILICFFCFAFFPFLAIIYFYQKRNIDLYISKREARTPFFLIAIASYTLGTILFLFTHTKIMFILALASLIVSILLLIINLFWKVSIHCAGVTGPIFALVFVFGANALPLTSIIGLVGWSRITLKNHTFAQTLSGTIISLLVGFLVFSIFYY